MPAALEALAGISNTPARFPLFHRAAPVFHF